MGTAKALLWEWSREQVLLVNAYDRFPPESTECVCRSKRPEMF